MFAPMAQLTRAWDPFHGPRLANGSSNTLGELCSTPSRTACPGYALPSPWVAHDLAPLLSYERASRTSTPMFSKFLQIGFFLLISRLKRVSPEDLGGLTFNCDIDPSVTDLSIGFVNIPKVEDFRLWVKLFIVDGRGETFSRLPKWRTSVTEGVPARPLTLDRQPSKGLPLVKLPIEREPNISINVSGRRNWLPILVDARTQIYITAHDAHSGLTTSRTQRID